MLVAIEGIDGAGKHTQTALLADRAVAEGLSVEVLSFPRYGAGLFGAAIGELLAGGLGDPDPRLAGLLFAGDRFEARHVVEAALSSADLVVADRWIASNLAYQSARAPAAQRPHVLSWLHEVEHRVFGLPNAALNVWLDLPVEQAVARLAARVADDRPAEDRYEADRDFLQACRDAYRSLSAGRPDWVCVAVEAPPVAVAEEVWRAVSERLADE
ncbi:MAG: tmk [Acidimicrobiaceae bacterium]|nr:tmk [Acidimicrobiaceae bacterium]